MLLLLRPSKAIEVSTRKKSRSKRTLTLKRKKPRAVVKADEIFAAQTEYEALVGEIIDQEFLAEELLLLAAMFDN